MEWVRALARLADERRPAVLVTVTASRGHTPRDAGAKLVVTEAETFGSVGGGNAEQTVVERARALLRAGAGGVETLDLRLNEHARAPHGRQCCGGEMQFLLEPLPLPPAVAVFGLGHVGLELARVLCRHELDLHLVDSRPGFADAAGATVAALDPVATVRTHATILPESVLADLPRGTHVLVMTHDHAEDFALCDAALRCDHLGSVGLIGSSAKWSRFRVRLRELGHTPADLDRITCPIGVPGITGKKPATIAVAVAAQLLARMDAGPGSSGAAELTSEAPDPACGVSEPITEPVALASEALR